MIAQRLPEIARRWDSECTRMRLLLGCGTVGVLGAGLCASASAAGNALDLFKWLFIMQALVLLGYGTTRVVASVSDEKRQGTWDLQRLTPQTAWQLAAGKLAGSPLYAVCLTAAFLPWALIAAADSPETGPLDVARAYAVLCAAAAFAWSLGLTISAHSDERQGLGDGGKFLLIAGLYPLLSWGVGSAFSPKGVAAFYGVDFPLWAFVAASGIVFAAWAFESARCRIAKDKLERTRSWRLPSFILFVAAYQLGLAPKTPSTAILFPLLATLLASVAEPWGAQEWRAWLRRPTSERILSAPAWLTGLTASAVLVPVLTIAARHPEDPSLFAWRFPGLFFLFLTRDILFLQWCRLKIKRQPEVFAVVYVAIAYALPGMIVSILKLQRFSTFLYCAAVAKDLPALVNLLPGLAQAGAMACLLAWDVRRLNDPDRRPRPAREHA